MEILTSFNSDTPVQWGEENELYIVKKGVIFPIKIYLEKDCSELVVFFPGAFNREKNTIPKFLRSTYSKKIKRNTITLFDPTLFLDSEIGIGWFQGTINQDYTELLLMILTEIINTLDIKYNNILFFATSAGGIPALKIARNFKDSTVYLGNIQTNLLKYYRGAVNKVIEHCYNGLSREEIEVNYLNRVSVINIDEDINVIYAQNEIDVFHYNNHFIPYTKELSLKEKIKYRIYTYVNEERGHGPLGQETETKIIDSIFNKNSDVCFNELNFKLYMSKG